MPPTSPPGTPTWARRPTGLCLDAAQFPPDVAATFAEAHRVLVPGGPAVFTGWEARDPDDPVVPERIRRVDLAAGLTGAGFVGEPFRRVLATGRRAG